VRTWYDMLSRLPIGVCSLKGLKGGDKNASDQVKKVSGATAIRKTGLLWKRLAGNGHLKESLQLSSAIIRNRSSPKNDCH